MRRVLPCAVAVVVGLIAVAGCSRPESGVQTPVASPVRPGALALESPLSAVRTYTALVTYAYRIGDSTAASAALTPDEGVRVDSYIELNRQRGRLIEQRLLEFSAGRIAEEATHALVPARERWAYRYLALDGSRPLDSTHTVTYETTYAVTLVKPGEWRVDSVEAKPLGKVP